MPGVSSTSSPRQGILGAAEFLASKGRNGDTQLTHTTTGETIVPEELLAKNPNLKKDLRLAFENEDIPMEQYVVGSGIMSVNPETGLYEAGWLKKTWKSVRKTVKKAGPVFLSYVAYLIPVFALIWGFIFLSEKIVFSSVVGIILVFIGLFVGHKKINE